MQTRMDANAIGCDRRAQMTWGGGGKKWRWKFIFTSTRSIEYMFEFNDVSVKKRCVTPVEDVRP